MPRADTGSDPAGSSFWLATPTSHRIVEALKRMTDGKPPPCPLTQKRGQQRSTELLFQAYRDTIVVVMLSVMAVNLKCKWCKVLEVAGHNSVRCV